MLALGFLLLLSAPARADARPGFDWPLPGAPVVARGFEPPSTAFGPGHRGVDLTATVGQPVLAAGPGRVTYAGLLAGRGVVTVTHAGGLRTTYEPVDPSVRVGALVTVGQSLGTLSSGHASCLVGTHCLHWGLLRGPVYLDPLSLVLTTRIRLLPLGSPATHLSPPPPLPSHTWPQAARGVAAAGVLVAGLGLLAALPAPGRGAAAAVPEEAVHGRAAPGRGCRMPP
jgi:murein DD-endopeptidase MepM/ murein hydrolase activator NlpD